MKRKLALILTCTMAATALFACGKDKENEGLKTEPTVEEQPAAEEPAAETVDSSAPTYAITSVEAGEGYKYFEGKVECLQITDDKHPELASAVEELFDSYVKSYNSDVETMNQQAQTDNEEMKKMAQEGDYEFYEMRYSRDVSVEVVRCDSQVFSFFLYDYMFTGGAHGTTTKVGYSFDATTGQQLTLADFGDATKIAETAHKYLLDTIDNSAKEAKDCLFPLDDAAGGYLDGINFYFDNGNTPDWYLSNRGLVFVFQQYDIAPYASGIIEFTVPFEAFEDFNINYVPDGSEFYTALSGLGFNEQIDVNGDTTLETVSVVSKVDENSGAISVILTVGDDNVVVSNPEYSMAGQPVYYHHTKDGNFIYISDYNGHFYKYQVDSGIKDLGTVDGENITDVIK